MNKIKGAIFDMDGTLVDSLMLWDVLWESFGKKYFTKIFSYAEIGKGKEKPDIYLMALEHLGTAKEETWVFEDSHIAIATADKIGMKTVGIYDKYNYGQEEIQKIAIVYVSKGETLEKLIS